MCAEHTLPERPSEAQSAPWLEVRLGSRDRAPFHSHLEGEHVDNSKVPSFLPRDEGTDSPE